MSSKQTTYGTLDVAVWTSPEFRALSDDSRLLFVYLKTCKHQNILGCYHAPDAYILSDLNWQDLNRLAGAKAVLSSALFAEFCERTDFIYLNKHLNKFPISDINRLKGAVSKLEETPKICIFKSRVAQKLSRILSEYTENALNNKGLQGDKKQKILEEIGGLEGAIKGLVTPSEVPIKALGSNTTTTATTTATTTKSSPAGYGDLTTTPTREENMVCGEGF